MSDMSVTSAPTFAPRVMEQSTPAAAHVIENTSIPTTNMSALNGAAPQIDMRSGESPMALSAKAPTMLKV